ncbi:hypothetical protein BD311DRAFT_720643 [Dichomitus squalens]|uniref:ER-bound oxygenase mpaB/mpaB'/Rubber oxygenase catalytic domain-containing protein n=1 Tax=Dichomitus squalens TaxID=114155 RepID=A0A4Q9MNZ9_9APHY|nr:hypothetical protein BD311DRAFT_720643 [Dichomitus squalens]
MVFIIGHPRPFRWSEVKHITSYEDMKSTAYEGLVETFGHVFEWDEDCVPAELCQRWRETGDPVCDDALREVFASPSASVGQDLLDAVQDYAEATSREEAPATHAFLDEVLHNPPEGLSATDDEVAVARQFFIDDSVQIIQALLHYSLAGGLARFVRYPSALLSILIVVSLQSPRIVRTLGAVSYLVPHTKKTGSELPLSLMEAVSQITKESTDRTFMRLVETMQFILDVMGCTNPTPSSDDSSDNHLASLLPEGEGWRSSVRVRLLHGIARWRVKARWEREGRTDVLDSVPLSQEEVAATLAAFSTIPIWCLQRLHLPPSPDKASAYLALWRHVGYYMGVSPSILLRYFTATSAADKFTATAALNLFFEDIPELPANAPSHSAIKGPTIPILVAVSNRPPLHTSLEYNIALTTHLVGTRLARRLGLPPTRLSMRLKMHAFLLVQRIPHYFAAWYPRKAWLEKRRAVLAEGMMRSVRWNMGLRRSTFRPRTAVHDTDVSGAAERAVDISAGGELAPGVAEAEAVQRDPVRAQVLTRQWKEVLYEMAGVSIAVGALACVALYLGAKCTLTAASILLSN